MKNNVLKCEFVKRIFCETQQTNEQKKATAIPFFLIIKILLNFKTLIFSGQITVECGSNQEFDECVNPCNRTCEEIRNNEPKRICIDVCRSGCKCIEGYIINKYHVCVPENKCQPKGIYV